MRLLSVSKLLLLLIILFSCNFNSNISKQKAAEIYVKLQVAEEKFRNSSDSLKIEQKKIFKEYSTSRQEFKEYLFSLSDDEQEWNEFFDLALKYVNDLKKKETN